MTIFESGIHEGLEVVFRVINIGEGCVMKTTKNALSLVQGAARQDAHVFEGNRVTLLRHDAAGLDIGVGETKITELDSAPLHKILGEAAKINHTDREYRAALRELVDGSDGAVGVHL